MVNSPNVHYIGCRQAGRKAIRDRLIEALKADKRVVIFYSKDYVLACRLPVPPTKKQRRQEVNRLRNLLTSYSGRRYTTIIVDEY